jgi:uncharacterized Zn finger protein (UPF0148 family)
MEIVSLHRSLDQELVALLRGASLECLVCGEFVMHARGGSVFCPECRAGRWREPGGESRRKVEQKGHRLGRISGDVRGKGETVG